MTNPMRENQAAHPNAMVTFLELPTSWATPYTECRRQAIAKVTNNNLKAVGFNVRIVKKANLRQKASFILSVEKYAQRLCYRRLIRFRLDTKPARLSRPMIDSDDGSGTAAMIKSPSSEAVKLIGVASFGANKPLFPAVTTFP